MQRPGRCAWSSARGLPPILSAFDALTSVSCRAIEIVLLTTLTLISLSLSLTLPDLEAFFGAGPVEDLSTYNQERYECSEGVACEACLPSLLTPT